MLQNAPALILPGGGEATACQREQESLPGLGKGAGTAGVGGGGMLLYHKVTEHFPNPGATFLRLRSPYSLKNTQEAYKVFTGIPTTSYIWEGQIGCLSPVPSGKSPQWEGKTWAPHNTLKKSFNFPFKHTILLNFEQRRIALNFKCMVFEINMHPAMTYFLLCSDLAHVKGLIVFTKKPLIGL